MRLKPFPFLFFAATLALQGQSRREHTRPNYDTGTSVTESQAADLTLTLTEAAVRPIQTWIRAGATIDKPSKVLHTRLSGKEAGLVQTGQRVRAFPPDAKSSIYQARVTRVIRSKDTADVEMTLQGTGRANSLYYVAEIIVERGRFLSIPNEAIIEEGDKHIVYVQQHPNHYVPQEIHLGLQGELYAEVHGLMEGAQVVTFGSFFIDAEHKLKLSGEPAMSNVHQGH